MAARDFVAANSVPTVRDQRAALSDRNLSVFGIHNLHVDAGDLTSGVLQDLMLAGSTAVLCPAACSKVKMRGIPGTWP